MDRILYFILLLTITYSAVLALLISYMYGVKWIKTRKNPDSHQYLTWHILGVGIGSVVADVAVMSAILDWWSRPINFTLFTISRVMFSAALTLILLFISRRDKWLRGKMKEMKDAT